MVTQVFLLLGSITEKEGKAKWDSQAEQIRKLVEPHGMEVFSKYFRRLLVGNSPQIFSGINRNVENPGNYQLLVQEMEKITQDSEQAPKIAEIVDASEGDVFRDFDLVTFMDHFKLDPIAKTLLASAFRHVSKPDLKKKAGDILAQTYQALIQRFGNVHNDDFDVPIQLLATAAFKYLQDIPPEVRNETIKGQVAYALNLRFQKQRMEMPSAIKSALFLVEMLESGCELAKEIQKCGPRVTSNLDAAKEVLSDNHKSLDEKQVAGALLFMVLSPDFRQYSPAVFVSAVRNSISKNFDWSKVVQGFDQKGLSVDIEQFLALFNALFPVAQQDSRLDIQILWGGRWQHPATQLSFVLAFVSLAPTELDATTIPDLRQSYNPLEYSESSSQITKYIEDARKDTVISVDAMSALFELVDHPDDPPSHEALGAVTAVIEAKKGFFLCSAAGTPKPWGNNQQSVMTKLLPYFMTKQLPEHNFVLHCLWEQDKSWVAQRLVEIHFEDPLKLSLILELAQEQEWLEELSTMMNGLGIDLVALAHRRDLLNIEQWAEEKLKRSPLEFTTAISRFLMIKCADEMRTVREEQEGPKTVNLAIRTVYALLDVLEQNSSGAPEELVVLERQCIQAFPRLINYGEGFDEIIEANGAESNSLPSASDKDMQNLYKEMYNDQTHFREIIKILQECKSSQEPSKQDLFACMIHGLFDEFVCFSEYPDTPLKTTASLFGGIVRCNLLSGLALRVALGMILEAIRNYHPDMSMYKFGVHALMTFEDRLSDWPLYCQLLAEIPSLQDVETYSKIAAIVYATGGPGRSNPEPNGINGLADGMGMSNGEFDEFLSPDTNVPFRSINADQASNSDFYADPDEVIQEKVVFFFNNVSEQNIGVKLREVQRALRDEHFQWFASLLVEERAKLEPNLQPLYMDLLKLLGKKALWAEVLRQTYVSVQRMLNAESTMNSPTERKNLKSLAMWLGSLTIARDKPIRHKNISFIDLLLEGFETERLLIVIPFTCSVLTQAKNSVVFRPPNPWIVEIVRLLLEIYNDADLKLNQKFEIEVLCKELDIDRSNVEPSTHLRDRPIRTEEQPNAMLSEAIEGFDDLTLGSINRPVRNARFSPSAIAATLPDFEPLLVFPPSSGSIANQARLRQVVHGAVRRAIVEIIAPVVERSVTIATIATQNLIRKDFVREPDEERIRKAAQQMVRQLSGSLALVTCKEPLRMSMTNYIRMAQSELPDQAFPEGAILMCVNDNLDTACSIVEKQAEERSMPEIETHIEDEIIKRRQFRAEHGNEPYMDGQYNRWANYIPDPFKQGPNGLNREQMAIYLEFARQSRGPANHAQTSSVDSGRQLPDVLQEAFAGVTNIHTPAETPAMPHQSFHQQQAGNLLPSSVPGTISQPQSNGYLDPRLVQQRMRGIIDEILEIAKEALEKSVKELSRDNPIFELLNQLWELFVTSPSSIDGLTMAAARTVCMALYDEGRSLLEIEILSHLLEKLCSLSSSTYKEVFLDFTSQEDDKLLNVPVTVSLLRANLMDLRQIDLMVSKLLNRRVASAVEFLSNILDELLLTSQPVALRADFALSLGALGQWASQGPPLKKVDELIARLWEWGVHDVVESRLDEKAMVQQHQFQYIFEEWLALCNHPNTSPKLLNAFIAQMHHKQLLNSQEDMSTFLRFCIDTIVEAYEQQDPNLDSSEGYFPTDCLAKLAVFLVRNQCEVDGAVKTDKAAYMDSVLSIVVLLLNNHHIVRGEQFNQRVFFRLFSSMLCEWHDFGRENYAQDRDILLIFAETFLAIEPRHIPGFTYSWLILVSHRLFMPALLKLADDEGWEPFANIMEAAIAYASALFKQPMMGPLAKDFYRGVLRILVILHHDFPEFLAENHYRLCNIIPAHCSQLRNLVLSAYPSSIPILPDPFTGGLKVDRLEEIRKLPKIAGDITLPLQKGNAKDLIDCCLRSTSFTDEMAAQVADIIYYHGRSSVDVATLHSMVLYIGGDAIASAGQKGGPSFAEDSPHAALLAKLSKHLQPEARFYFLSAIADQLRYPNSHTHYFSYALLHLFGSDLADQQQSDVRQQITRVLLERLIVHRPHPWGLIITLLELIKNPAYNFWELPFIKAAPQVKNMFAVLFQHIQQSPRALA